MNRGQRRSPCGVMEDVTAGELRSAGWSARQIERAVLGGELLRLRRGHYASAATSEPVRRAVRIGGRLGCVSELRHRGIWVLDDRSDHVQVREHASRLHDPEFADHPYRESTSVHLHWHDEAEAGTPGHASVLDALADASSCLERRAWVASVDSAIHLGALPRHSLPRLAGLVATASRAALVGVDPRAESGLESIVRVLAQDLGFRVTSHVRFNGIGRVDLIVEDWIVVETDGAAFHDVSMSPRDRRRDAQLTARGFSVVRPGYSLVVHDPATVARQLIGAVSIHRRVAGAGNLAARARIRARRLGFS
jgi:very-short-patch-repair endonuclease